MHEIEWTIAVFRNKKKYIEEHGFPATADTWST